MTETPRTSPGTSPRTRANRIFFLRFGLGMALYLAALFLAYVAEGSGFPAWIPALLVVPAVLLVAWANIDMYRSGDEFERRKIAEAILIAFVISTSLILAVGVLQFYLLPAVNWIFAFAILMGSWLLGTLVSAVRHR
ncbi:MAG: hypothetical protein ACTHWF_07075 [Brachybacterium sp.]